MSTKAPSRLLPRASVQRARSRTSTQGPPRRLLGRLVEELGLRILKGDYAAGAALPIEPELMRELGVSRTVLREAIKILTANGLIESRGKLGTRVRERKYWNLLDPTILHLYCRVAEYSVFAQGFQQLRAIIEPEAAALAAQQRSASQLRALEAACDAMATAKDIDEWTAADLRFHEGILDATCNPFMRPLGALISAALETLLFHSAENSADSADALTAHRGVLDAIRRRDAVRARAAMKALLARTALFVSKSIRKVARRRIAVGNRAGSPSTEH